MFVMPAILSFGQANTLPGMRDAFAAPAAVVPPTSNDVEVATETFSVVLHGLAQPERSGWIRRKARDGWVARVGDGLLDDCLRPNWLACRQPLSPGTNSG